MSMPFTDNGIECFECGRATQDDLAQEGDECPQCGSSNTGAVRIDPCPHDVTSADWRSGESLGRCDSDIHEWKSGLHIASVD